MCKALQATIADSTVPGACSAVRVLVELHTLLQVQAAVRVKSCKKMDGQGRMHHAADPEAAHKSLNLASSPAMSHVTQRSKKGSFSCCWDLMQ